MKEFPIILETTGSELFEECITQSDADGGPSEGPHDDLSILMEDASMPIAVIGMGFRGPADATDTNRLWQMMVEKEKHGRRSRKSDGIVKHSTTQIMRGMARWVLERIFESELLPL